MDSNYLKKNKILVDKWITNHFKKIENHNSLQTAIKYGVKNGGKRLRPFFIIELSKILKIPSVSYRQLSLAIEFIHCYSLIHDDLPSMDNDNYRRGKLTVHKKFKESTAILAGNSLYGMAIELILDNKTCKNLEVRQKILKLIIEYTGYKGLMYGQFNDLYYENKNTSVNKIISTYELKTSKLFQLSTSLPFILNQSDKKSVKKAQVFGRNFGIIYQIADDFSDNDRGFKEIGKTPGKDRKKGKQTLISKIGRKEALKLCYKLANDATNDINIFGQDKYKFKKLMLSIIIGIERNNNL